MLIGRRAPMGIHRYTPVGERHGAVGTAIALLHPRAARAAEGQPTPQPLEPLVWPRVGGEQPGIRTFAGHANTVLDIVGRIGTPPSLVIFTEGNHLMVV